MLLVFLVRFSGSLEDQHPDAHAVRCKLVLQVAFVEDVQMPFEIHVEVDPELFKEFGVEKNGTLSSGGWILRI